MNTTFILIIVILISYTALSSNQNLSTSSKTTTEYILAIGDSYTAGLSFINPPHPYADQLNSKFKGNNIPYEIISKGIGGEKSFSLKERLINFLNNKDELGNKNIPNSSITKFKAVIILTGLNDFTDVFKTSKEISSSIIDSYNVAINNNLITFIVTFPQTRWMSKDPEKYIKGQEVIKDLVTFYNGIKRTNKNVYFCNLDEYLNINLMTPTEIDKYFDNPTKYKFDELSRLKDGDPS